jgi:hypothetical protein
LGWRAPDHDGPVHDGGELVGDGVQGGQDGGGLGLVAVLVEGANAAEPEPGDGHDQEGDQDQAGHG